LSRISELTRDPLRVNAFLIVLAFGSVFVLPSQSASSLITYVLGVAMLLAIPRWRHVLDDPLLVLAVLLQAYLALSSFWSDPFVLRKAGSMGGRVLVTALFLVAFVECWPTGIVQRWFGRVLVLCAGGSALTAIVNFILTHPVDGRLNGLGQIGTHVIAALLWGVALIFLLDSLRQGCGPRWRALALTAGAPIVTAITLTASRNAWVSVLLGVAVYGSARLFEDRRRFFGALAALAGLIALTVVILLQSESGREFLLPRGDSFRPLIWSTILGRVWEGGIVFGVGILTSDDVRNGPWTYPHPHSMYLSVLYQGGVVALAGFVLLIAFLVRRLLAHYGVREAKLALAILGIALPSYLLDGHELVDRIGETWLLFWLPVGLALCLRTPRPPR